MRFRTVCIVAAMLVGSAPVAFAQGGMTDRNYNSTGSQGVGNGGGMRAAPGEHATTGSTAGMRSTRRSRTESTRGETAHHATRKGAATGQEQR